MLIRHDPHLSRGRILRPVPRHEYLPSSLSLPKDQFGNDVFRRHFIVSARLADGHAVWKGIFYDRDDADAFLYAIALGTIAIERELWNLPTPAWHPDIGENLTYHFATREFITAVGAGTYTSPSTWTNSSNTVEGIGSGGSGTWARGTTVAHAPGGGGGEYRAISNYSFASPGVTTVGYSIGNGGNGVGGKSGSGDLTTAGNAGTNTTWNTTTLIAVAGGVGTPSNTTTNSVGGVGGTGGTGAAGNYNGGNGGDTSTGNRVSTGGGGAGGPKGAGANGTSGSGSNANTAGGAGGGGFGGASNSGNGTEWGAAGSGGGGNGNSSSTAGSGGNYGAGGAGFASTGSTTSQDSGDGANGILVLTYGNNSLVYNPNFQQHILVR